MRALADALGPSLGLLACGVIPVALIFITRHFKLRTRELELEAELHSRASQARRQAVETRLAALESALGSLGQMSARRQKLLQPPDAPETALEPRPPALTKVKRSELGDPRPEQLLQQRFRQRRVDGDVLFLRPVTAGTRSTSWASRRSTIRVARRSCRSRSRPTAVASDGASCRTRAPPAGNVVVLNPAHLALPQARSQAESRVIRSPRCATNALVV